MTQPLYIVYDNATNKILRNVTELPILTEHEAVCQTSPGNQRADIQRVREFGTIAAGALAPIGALAQARQAASDAFDLYKPGHDEPLDRFLPNPASPTGELPATHHFCFFRGSPEMVNNCVAFVPFKQYGICELSASHGDFLARHGLKAVS
jgi:hypothetical protein